MGVLIVDDAGASLGWACEALTDAGFEAGRVLPAGALAELARAAPEAVLVDLAVAGAGRQDAFRFIEALRASDGRLPVVILSALGHADERVRGRRAGADLLLTKPVAAVELVLRLRGLIEAARRDAQERVLSCGDLSMQLGERRVARAGRAIELKPGEFRMLEQLLRHKDHVVTRGMLLETVWNYRFDPHTSLIETHVSRLRRKIDDGFARPLLHTRRGVGYELSETP